MKRPGAALAALIVGLAVVGCDEASDVAKVAPREPGAAAVGYYCGMLIVDHAGPKGQIFLEGKTDPIWFSSVRDTLAFTMLPEEPKNIAAIYVNDMAKAANWEQPEPGTWIKVRDALYVAGSDARGGMGGPEVVPFGDRAAAERFRTDRGGEIYAFDAVPEHYVLGGAAGPDESTGETRAGHSRH